MSQNQTVSPQFELENKILPGEKLIERLPSTENGAETGRERVVEIKPEIAREEPVRPKNAAAVIPPAASPVLLDAFGQKERKKKIEHILEEGLVGVYQALTPDVKARFRQKGEETAGKINQLLNETKIRIKSIIELIIEWLKVIPGVNRFFLEQEAKIKADEIIKLAAEDKKEGFK